jgi:hypothetical protein
MHVDCDHAGTAKTIKAMKKLVILFLAAPALVLAQGTNWNESWVGSEWDTYARALADRGLLSTEPWSVRPFAPQVVRRWAGANRADTNSKLIVLRPSISASNNSGFAWGMQDGPVWQGRGTNVWGSTGLALHLGPFSARIAPLVEYAENRAFTLTPVRSGSISPFVDDLRPTTIDEPQRFGNSSFHIVDPGQSFVRVDGFGMAAGFSTEDIFWGPGVHQALLFDANAAGFPHVFVGTSHGISTPIGRFHAQLIYGRLEESDYAPTSDSKSRFGSGGIAVWMPPGQTIEIGVARFYHRAWPAKFTSHDFFIPFGTLYRGGTAEANGTPENQLASVFATIRVPNTGFEVFGEFGKNDRNADLRDALAEPEHNSAWMLGAFKVLGMPGRDSSFWTVRAEIGNARIPELQDIGREQSTFYDHTQLTQGHTQYGQLLGSPLIDRSGGVDFSLDRWTSRGRLGISIFERQMPGDLEVGLPADQLRTQWDLGVNGFRTIGKSDVTFALGHVWDLDRFPKTDVGNMYFRLGLRAGLP